MPAPVPPLRTDYTDVRIPGPNEYSATEYIANATRTDAAYAAIEPDVICPNVTTGSAGAAAGNTSSINAAIATGAIVRLPKGDLYHNGLILPDLGFRKLKGSGKHVTILKNNHASNPSIKADNTAGSSTCRNWVLEDMTVDSPTLRTGQIGLDVHLAVDWSVNNVEVLNHDMGVRNRISWGGNYNNLYIGLCTTGFKSELTTASAPLVANNMNIYNCVNGFWSDEGLTQFIWNGGTVTNNTANGMRLDGFTNGGVHLNSVDFENNTAEDALLGDADSGPCSVKFTNCVFHGYVGQAHPRSVYARFGVAVTLDTCWWRDEHVVAVQVGGGMGTVLLLNPRFNGVTTHVVAPSGSYQLPNGTSSFVATGFGASALGVQRSGAGVSPVRQVVNVTPAAAPAINVDTAELFSITAQNVPITSMTSGLTGSPFQGQKASVWISDNGTAQPLAWGAKFSGPLPTTTVVGQTTKVDLEYDSTAAVWVYRSKEAPPDVQIFATVGTTNWVRPPGATPTSVTDVIAVGGGGGGGSGAREPSGTVSCGGGGGGGGAITFGKFKTLDLTPTVSVIVGAGGAGGAAIAVNGTAGASAGLAALTQFGSYLLGGRGSPGGGGGAGTVGAGGGGGSGTMSGGTGTASLATGLTGTATPNGVGIGAGGAGGGITAVPAASAGSNGGTSNTSLFAAQPAGGAATGAPGAPGAVGSIPYVASGGAGGGASSTAAGGNGGDGGTPGGGGGGGGASLNGFNSGAGGKGGDGYCIAITTF